MKANELMIGDYVTFADCQKDKYPSIVKIWQINEAGEAFVSIDGNEALDEIAIDDEIVGIPITPEILEKNGFRKLVTYGTEKWLCDNLRLNVYSSDGTWRFCADTNRNENSVIYIRFVHELQNAISLCGIEKEIVL